MNIMLSFIAFNPSNIGLLVLVLFMLTGRILLILDILKTLDTSIFVSAKGSTDWKALSCI